MNKRNRVIISAVIISLSLLAMIFFAYHEGYLFRILWEGDNPNDDFHCGVYDIYPRFGEGLNGNLPPQYLACYVDTNALPDHVYAKFQWQDDNGFHRSGRIWFDTYNNIDGEVTRIDSDTYYVKFFISNYASSSDFQSYSYYQWKVEIYFCLNPPSGTGESMWDTNTYYSFYTDNRPPVNYYPNANAGGPYIVYVGEVLQLDGSGSTTEGNSVITAYLWDLRNDGVFDAGGKRPKFRFTTPTTYQLKLRVINSYGLYDEDTTTITVLDTTNNPPTADADGPYSGYVGENIQLDGSGSYDPDGNPLSYEWDVDGDGTYDLTGKKVNVTYYQSGTFNIVLKVSDGQYSDTDTTTATISASPPPPPTNEPPVAEAGGPYECYAGKWVILDGSGSYDPDGYIVEYKWDIDNDGIWDLYGEEVNVTFYDTGTFTVKLNVTDDDGATAEDTAVVTVLENPSPPQTPPEEENVYEKYWWLFGIIALTVLIPIGFIIWRDKNEKKKY